MPNWCYNKIQFADREGFERAASLLRSDGGGSRLSSIIKMPESVSIASGDALQAALQLFYCLHATDSERAAVDEYREQRVSSYTYRSFDDERLASKIRRMWDDTAENLAWLGADVPIWDGAHPMRSLDEIDRLAVDKGVALQFGEDDFTCDGVVEYGRVAVDNIVKHGAVSWYDWACKNWGTKWDAEIEVDDGEAEMTCTTAWCPPIEAFQKLAADCAAALVLSYDDEQFAVVTGVVSILDDGEVYEEKCDELSMYELFQVAASVTDPDQEEYRLDPDTFKVVWRGEDADDFDSLPVVDLFDSPADKALARLRRAL